MEKIKVLNQSQHGFSGGRSTITALLDMVVHISDELESGNLIMGCFLDLTKAFDCVSHIILLHKLKHYGIRDHTLSFVKIYLLKSFQYVHNGGEQSSIKQLNCDVPQRSTLGPILFIFYVNDINEHITYKNIRYADGTTILLSYKNIELLNDMYVCTIMQFHKLRHILVIRNYA